MRLLDRINKTGTTVVMATHDQRIVNMMRKRVIQLDRGVIVRDQARGVYEMISRLRYTLREMWASLTRNVTLTVAAIITSTVSLFLFGLTLLIQQAFDNLLQPVDGRRRDDRLRQRTAPQPDAVATHRRGAAEPTGRSIKNVRVLRCDCSLGRGQDAVRRRPRVTRQFLLRGDVPSYFKVVPTDKDQIRRCCAVSTDSFSRLPGVYNVALPVRADQRFWASCRASSACGRTSIVRGAAVRLGPADLEHDPHRDVRPTT